MEKKTVMKALSVCGRGIESCPECPYFNEAACGRHMCDDALALIKADEKANEKPTYHKAFIFTKRDNLLKWFDVHAYKYAWGANMEYSDQYKKMEALYAMDRFADEFGKGEQMYDIYKRYPKLKGLEER